MRIYPPNIHDRDRLIRLAVSKLTGPARTAAIDHLLKHPEELRKKLSKRMKNRPTSFTMRMTVRDYDRLEVLASNAGMNMSQYIRMKVGL